MNGSGLSFITSPKSRIPNTKPWITLGGVDAVQLLSHLSNPPSPSEIWYYSFLFRHSHGSHKLFDTVCSPSLTWLANTTPVMYKGNLVQGTEPTTKWYEFI